MAVAIAETCPVPMFLANFEGDWAFVNVYCQRALLRESSELLDRGWFRFVYEADRDIVHVHWRHLVERKLNAHHIQIRFVQKTGHVLRGYMDVAHVKGVGFVGWFMPICEEPVECPMHQTLLRNVASISSGTRIPTDTQFDNGT